ncbi:hypothetical protein B0I66_004391 [Clostridium beijerinckii]|nr:hypothetical protein [Clostridium beijerinckii]NRT85216.1 hypothetical protein [Clostridium beijerinckii]
MNLLTSEYETSKTLVSPSVKFIINIAFELSGSFGSVVSFLVTFIVQKSLRLLPSFIVAVIIHVPSSTAVTLPVESTVAIDSSLDFHIT